MKSYYLVSLLLILFGIDSAAQLPQGFSYQFVVRGAGGMVLGDTEVSIRISILQGNSDGPPVYIETHTITTSANGVGSFKVGSGSSELSQLSEINWSDGPFFIKTETDPEGGNDYSLAGTAEILSVPYALYAENGYFRKIGDLAEGGVIFSLWKDAQGVEHGLVMALEEFPTSVWGVMYEQSGASQAANGIFNVGTSIAGEICENYTYEMDNQVYNDWYLPAIWELRELSNKAFLLNSVLESDNDESTVPLPSNVGAAYWSSTEINSTFSWYVEMGSGIANSNFKDTSYRIRAIRRF